MPDNSILSLLGLRDLDEDAFPDPLNPMEVQQMIKECLKSSVKEGLARDFCYEHAR